MRHFFFNGKDSRTYFSFTNSIARPFLPPIVVPSVQIPNKAGAIALKRNDIGVREITIGVTLFGLNNGDLRTKIRNLADFLVYEEDKDLYFSDEVNRVYKARYSGNAELEELVAMGEGSLTFICYDPFAYSNAKTTLQFGTAQELTVTNEGSLETYPFFRVVVPVDVPLLKIRNMTTGKNLLYNSTLYGLNPLIVDMASNAVYHDTTKENLMRNVTLDSNFWSLAKGNNLIRIETAIDGTANLSSTRIDFTSRYY